MDDTGLHERLGPCGLDRVREALQAVTAHDQRVFEASVAYLGKYRQPVFGAFSAVAEPYPQHVFTAVHVHSNHHVRWAVDDSSVGSDLDDHGIYVQEGITPIKGPVLPVCELL